MNDNETKAAAVELLRAALVNVHNATRVGVYLLPLVATQIREALALLGEPRESLEVLERAAR